MPARTALLILAPLLVAAATVPQLSNYADDFDRLEARTRGQPERERVAAVRAAFDNIIPGLYSDADDKDLDRQIARSLAEFPSQRERYRRIVSRFPGAFDEAIVRFRKVFPQFAPPMPVALVHSLGQRDGGSTVVRGRKVMLFGADLIAKIHDDDSFQPFLDHELFHLEHARHFADCDQFWCPLWQEGLATYAAAVMTPGASDHQLMLDQPAAIRGPTDTQWGQALCLIAGVFDTADQHSIGEAFLGNRHPSGLPARYGYYVGFRIAAEAARDQALPVLARLDDDASRPIVAAALGRLIVKARAPCASPTAVATITHAAPRSP